MSLAEKMVRIRITRDTSIHRQPLIQNILCLGGGGRESSKVISDDFGVHLRCADALGIVCVAGCAGLSHYLPQKLQSLCRI